MLDRITRTIPALGAAAVLALGGGAAAVAHGGDGSGHHDGSARHGHARVSAWDAHWLMMAIQGDRAEIAAGTLAQSKGVAPGVKAFGTTLVTDHTAHLQQAAAVARRTGVKVPGAPSPTQQWAGRVLQSLSGTAFDTWFSDLMVQDHLQMISETRSEAREGRNRRIRRLAKATLPVLRRHLEQARALAGS